MNIRGLHARLSKIERNAPAELVVLWGLWTKAEQDGAIKAKAEELGIRPANVTLDIVRWMGQ